MRLEPTFHKDTVRHCKENWPIPARYVINTKLAEHVTRRVTEESEASFHATTSKRHDASGATPIGK